MRLFVCYIRQRWRGIAVGALFCAVFVVSFILYHLPVEAVLYPGALCVLFGLILMAADYRRVKKKHEALESISSITDVLTGTFPDAKELMMKIIKGSSVWPARSITNIVQRSMNVIGTWWIIIRYGSIKSRRRSLLCGCICKTRILF